jgi:hypothetical protein
LGKAKVEVGLGQSITVDLKGKAVTNALAYYVALESQANGAVTDAVAAAWAKLVTGDINKVVRITDSKSVRLLITNDKESFGKLPIDKEIGLRLFVVNIDGTLVDPDGRAFYLTLTNIGDQIEFTTTVDDVVPTPNTSLAFDSIKPSFIENMSAEIRKQITSLTLEAEGLQFVDEAGVPINGQVQINLLQSNGTPAAVWADGTISHISIAGRVIPSSFGSSAVTSASGTIIVKGKDDKIIDKCTVTLNRNVALKDLGLKPEKLDPKYPLTLLPTSDGMGSISLESIFDALKLENEDRLKVTITSEGVPTSSTTGVPTLFLTKTGIQEALSDNRLYKATVGYSYGYIYSKTEEYLKDLEETEFQFFSNLQSMTWNMIPVGGWSPKQGMIAYGENNTIPLETFTSNFKGEYYTLVDSIGYPQTEKKTYKLTSASLITKNDMGISKEDMYYDIVVSEGMIIFTPKGSLALDPKSTHKLRLEIQDVFEGIVRVVEKEVEVQ